MIICIYPVINIMMIYTVYGIIIIIITVTVYIYICMIYMALWHLDALCYESCKGHGTTNSEMGSLEWNWPKEAMNKPIWTGIVDGAKLFKF